MGVKFENECAGRPEERHPNISVFGSTESCSFPLIMVVGREPNTQKTVDHFVGEYDFTKHTRIGFWNSSHWLIASRLFTSLQALKQWCIYAKASPIIYADAFPIGIPTQERNKNKLRRQVKQDQIKHHHQNIFRHEQIMKRVELVILSGLSYDVFNTARESFIEMCKLHHKQWIQLPFFSFFNTKKMKKKLTKTDSERIREICADFSHAHPPV